MRPTTLVTHDELLSLLKYDADSGVFVWRVDRHAVAKAGDVAGSLDRGKRSGDYWRLFVLGRRYAAHRLAFFYVNGRWPIDEIDHINGNTLDNRIANLREVSRSGNAQNIRRARKDSSSGLIGAMLNKKTGKFRVYISARGVRKYIGCFKTAKEAHESYVLAKRTLHNTCTL